MAIEDIFLGTQMLSSYVDDDNGKHAVRVVFADPAVDTEIDITRTEKLFLGGDPLTLARMSNGQFSLMVVRLSGFTVPSVSSVNQLYVWFGSNFFIYENSGMTRNIFVISENTSSSNDSPALLDDSGEASTGTNVSGIPLAINSDNELLMVDSAYTLNDIDEVGYFDLGGISLDAVRVDTNWYLATSDL